MLSSTLLPLNHSQYGGILKCFSSCLWTCSSSIRKLRTVCAKLRRSMGKRTKNQDKNTNLNTYLDPSPSGAVPSSTCGVYESNICSWVWWMPAQDPFPLQHRFTLLFPSSQTLLASPTEGSVTSPIPGRWASIKPRERLRVFCHSIFFFSCSLFPLVVYSSPEKELRP